MHALCNCWIQYCWNEGEKILALENMIVFNIIEKKVCLILILYATL